VNDEDSGRSEYNAMANVASNKNKMQLRSCFEEECGCFLDRPFDSGPLNCKLFYPVTKRFFTKLATNVIR